MFSQIQQQTFLKKKKKNQSWTSGDFLREVQLKAQLDQLDHRSTPHTPDQTGALRLTQQLHQSGSTCDDDITDERLDQSSSK